MNVDSQKVIEMLSRQVAQLSVALAVKDAQIEAMRKQEEVKIDGE